jgi:sigma-B regulation protein RsbU (phosphoserine phosphatase)
LVSLFFAAGLYFVFSKNSVAEFENYVPAYVSRIAERERFLKELEIARSIQMRFLPATPPVFPKLDIACLCKPAMEVGGDYYDFIKHDDSRLGVVIGDVSGKGVSAAFFMTMAKGIIKALSRINPSPKSLLSDMNSVFYENTPKEVFISLIYGFFDVNNNTFIFARAGHNPLIVRKSVGGAPELLNPRGLAIGMEKGPVFSATIEEKALPIQAGDVFLFYTDGISEAMNKNGDEFGEDRLSQLASQYAGEPAHAILDKITDDVTRFANGAKQHDDFTMVVVKVVS